MSTINYKTNLKSILIPTVYTTIIFYSFKNTSVIFFQINLYHVCIKPCVNYILVINNYCRYDAKTKMIYLYTNVGIYNSCINF